MPHKALLLCRENDTSNLKLCIMFFSYESHIKATFIHACLAAFHFSNPLQIIQTQSPNCFQSQISLKKWVRKYMWLIKLQQRIILKAWRTETWEKTVWDKQLFREFLRKENVETETYMITPTEFKECRTEFITSFTGHTCFSLFTLYFNCTRKWQNISQNTVVYFPNLNFAQFWWDICKFKSGINSSCSIPLTFKLLVYSH